MIAVFLTEPQIVHVVFHIGREGLMKVKTHGYCGATGDAGDGTYQIPDQAFNGPLYVPPGAPIAGAWNVCPKCALALKRLRDQKPAG